jgi:3-isopropylmalate dehydrogenase
MVILRENTEDLYSGIGGSLRTGGLESVAVDTRLITREASQKVIRKAFELCRKRPRGAPGDGKKRVTAVVKDNVLQGCKLFAQVFREVGRDYPDIEQETAIVDAFTQWLIGQPEHYDVVVTTNMFGDIVTDLASVLQGGMGMAVGCNVGENHAMFEPIHGSAPKYAGQDKVNPIAMILSLREALDWLGERPRFADQRSRLIQAGNALEAAVTEVLQEGRWLTYDLVGAERACSGTRTTQAIIEALGRQLERSALSSGEAAAIL